MLRLISFSLKTSTAAFARSSVSDSTLIASSPVQAIEVPVPRKSNRCDSSLAAWLRALNPSQQSQGLNSSPRHHLDDRPSPCANAGGGAFSLCPAGELGLQGR